MSQSDPSPETLSLPEDPSAWELLITQKFVELTADGVSAAARTSQFSTHVYNNQAQLSWLPMATRYISHDRSVILVEKEPSIIKRFMFPWTYYLFDLNAHTCKVFVRPLTLLSPSNEFYDFFLTEHQHGYTFNISDVPQDCDFRLYINQTIMGLAEAISTRVDAQKLVDWLKETFSSEDITNTDQITTMLTSLSVDNESAANYLLKTLWNLYPFIIKLPAATNPYTEADEFKFSDITSHLNLKTTTTPQDVYKIFKSSMDKIMTQKSTLS